VGSPCCSYGGVEKIMRNIFVREHAPGGHPKCRNGNTTTCRNGNTTTWRNGKYQETHQGVSHRDGVQQQHPATIQKSTCTTPLEVCTEPTLCLTVTVSRGSVRSFGLFVLFVLFVLVGWFLAWSRSCRRRPCYPPYPTGRYVAVYARTTHRNTDRRWTDGRIDGRMVPPTVSYHPPSPCPDAAERRGSFIGSIRMMIIILDAVVMIAGIIILRGGCSCRCVAASVVCCCCWCDPQVPSRQQTNMATTLLLHRIESVGTWPT
jgi:hypothetical protein